MTTMQRSISAVFALFATCASATPQLSHFATTKTEVSTSAQQGEESDIIDRARKKSGMKMVSSATGQEESDSKNTDFDTYFDSVVYMDSYEKITNGAVSQDETTVATGGNNAFMLATPAADMIAYAKTVEAENRKKEAQKKEAESKTPSYFGGGYCTMETPVTISRSSEFSTLSCLINFGESEYRKVDVFIGVYPDYKRELLVGIPIYATFENGKRANVNGIVMRRNRSSINIADYVDAQRLRKLTAENALAINDVAYRYSTAYLQALQLSRIQEDVQYVNTVDPNTGNSVPVPVATRNIAPPKATDYFAAAGIEIVSQIFASIGKEYLYDTRPLFEIHKGKMVWMEGIFEFDHSKISMRYGKIAENQVQNADKNNNAWIRDRNKIIDKYDIDKRDRRGNSLLLQNSGLR